MNKSQLKIEVYRMMEGVIGKGFIRKSYLKSCVKRFKKADCIFIHIPKAGGTSVAMATMGKRAGHFSSLEIENEMGSKLYSDYFSFTVTRDPAHRLYSAYNYAVNGGGSHGGVSREEYFNLPAFRSFDSFVEEWLVLQDLNSTNLLFRPQSYFLLNQLGELNVKYVGKLETLDKVEIELTRSLGREITINKKNVTSKRSSHKISSPTLSLIQNLYEQDYNILKY